jgi:hypothetical protein
LEGSVSFRRIENKKFLALFVLFLIKITLNLLPPWMHLELYHAYFMVRNPGVLPSYYL